MDIKLAIPVAGVFTKTFLFGESPSWYVNQFKEPHNGIDYAVPIGTPIVASDTGILAWADNVPDADGCGIAFVHLGNVFANLRGVYTFKIQIKTEQRKGENGNYMSPANQLNETVNSEDTPF